MSNLALELEKYLKDNNEHQVGTHKSTSVGEEEEVSNKEYIPPSRIIPKNLLSNMIKLGKGPMPSYYYKLIYNGLLS